MSDTLVIDAISALQRVANILGGEVALDEANDALSAFHAVIRESDESGVLLGITALRGLFPEPPISPTALVGIRRVASKAGALRIILSAVKELELHQSQSRSRKPRRESTSQKKTWTKAEVEAAVRNYKANRSEVYAEFCEKVRRNASDASKQARIMFGRNAIARSTGCLRTMVGKSKAWRAIGAELKLRKADMQPARRRVGFDKAIEKAAVAKGRSQKQDELAALMQEQEQDDRSQRRGRIL